MLFLSQVLNAHVSETQGCFHTVACVRCHFSHAATNELSGSTDSDISPSLYIPMAYLKIDQENKASSYTQRPLCCFRASDYRYTTYQLTNEKQTQYKRLTQSEMGTTEHESAFCIVFFIVGYLNLQSITFPNVFVKIIHSP